MKKRLRYIVITIIFLSIVGYVYYQTRDLSRGPVLIIDSPVSGTTLIEPKTNIKGTVKNASYVTLNGRQIFINEENKFNETVLLSTGYNVMEITVEDRFERIKTEKIELVYEVSE